jgi:hypothetical protein
MNKQIYFIIGILLILPCISAYDIFGTFKQGDTVRLYQYCDSCSYVNITTMKYPNGTVATINDNMIKDGTDYYYYWNYTEDLGDYFYTVCGDKDGEFICEDMKFDITINGTTLTEGSSYAYIGLLVLLGLFLILCAYLFVKYDNLLARVSLFGIGYLLLVGITFIAWDMAKSFLILSFTADMFRILFFVLISLAFPLLIGAFAWYIILLIKIKEIERLMSRGFSSEEAEYRIKRRKR